MSERPAALVTGGASGVARATVERFLATGWDAVAAGFVTGEAINVDGGERSVVRRRLHPGGGGG